MTELVSIITPTYNHEKFIARCIESVLSQTYSWWEMIIIDDASIDRTASLIKDYAKKDRRIKFVRHDKNWGIYRLAEIYNQALEMSQGKYIAILEGDDFWPASKLKEQTLHFRENDVVLSWGRVGFTDESENYLGIIPTKKYKIDVLNNRPTGKILKVLLIKSIIPPVGTLIRKDALLSINGFQGRNYLPFVDYPTFLFLALKGEFRFTESIVGYWRRHGEQATAIFGENQERASTQFVAEFLPRIPKEIKKKFDLHDKVILNYQKYRSAYPYFGQGRMYLACSEFEAAKSCFKLAFKKGSPEMKLKAFLGIIMSLLKKNMEKYLFKQHERN